MVVRALIVDDDSEGREMMALLVDLAGARVVAAVPTGAAALAILTEHVVDLLLTDYQMPTMDGLALAQIAHRQWPSVAVVLMTGYDVDHLPSIARTIGLFDILVKPISVANFQNLLSRLHPLPPVNTGNCLPRFRGQLVSQWRSPETPPRLPSPTPRSSARLRSLPLIRSRLFAQSVAPIPAADRGCRAPTVAPTLCRVLPRPAGASEVVLWRSIRCPRRPSRSRGLGIAAIVWPPRLAMKGGSLP